MTGLPTVFTPPVRKRLLCALALMAIAQGAVSQQQETTPHDSSFRNAIRGIWWSPDMFQTAAFRIDDSTIYYPDAFAEFTYEVKGDSLLVFRDNGEIASSVIIKVSADTLILFSFGRNHVYTRSETKTP